MKIDKLLLDFRFFNFKPLNGVKMPDSEKKDTNINRRKFLKKMAKNAIFVAPTITTFSLAQTRSPWWWWTGHHHHKGRGDGRPLPPPPPAGYSS